uniref:Class I SAM-dependent methyltransferase n=1 Tax=Ignavibacterium album TaxID=591197 RepID=A0A7V2ZK77_9BACT
MIFFLTIKATSMTKIYRDIFYKSYFSEKSSKGSDSLNQKRMKNWSKATLLRIKSWLPADKNVKILDIGCGFGLLLNTFKEEGYNNLVGVDISEEQINIAKKLFPEIDFICSDLISYLKNNQVKYDLVTAFDVLEHLDKQEAFATLELICNNLIEHGQLIIQTPNAESPWFGTVAYGDFTHEWFYTTSSIEDILLKTGFKRFDFLPSEPMAINLKSFIRKIIWSIIKLFLVIWNLAETGSKGSKIYTRVFLARAVK